MRFALCLVVFTLFAQDNVQKIERPSEAVLRSWSDWVDVNGTHEMGRIEYVFDYDRGIPLERQYSESGLLVRESIHERHEIRASSLEITLAKDLVRSDSELARFLDEEGRVLDGGFILNEKDPAPCGPGSRCIHVVAFDDDETHPVFQAVVDLVSMRVIYRNYTRNGKVQP